MRRWPGRSPFSKIVKFFYDPITSWRKWPSTSWSCREPSTSQDENPIHVASRGNTSGEASDQWRASMPATSRAPVLPECMVR